MCGNAGFTCLRWAIPRWAELIRTSRCKAAAGKLASAGFSNETWMAA